LAVVVVFGQTVNHDFVSYDDDIYVCDNSHVVRGLTGEGAAWAITAHYAFNWHPLTWLSHMLDCQFYGLKAAGHHLTSVLLHAAAAVLLFLALRRMTRALWPSAWVAAVFAIHPLRVESVAWVAERKDVLSGLLFMLTLWFYARYVERPRSWGRYLAVLASFALGLTAKPMLVTLPLVLLLLDYWPLGRMSRGQMLSEKPPAPSGRGAGGEGGSQSSAARSDHIGPIALRRPLLRLIVEKIPMFILAAASCLATLAAQRDVIQPLQQLAFAGRVANAALAYVAYLGKMLYPAGLAVLYPLPQGPPPVWDVVAAVAVLWAISTAVFVLRRKCPYLLCGWLWYLGTLVPVIGLVQVGPQAMADRYTYLPQIGLCAAVAWGAVHAAGSWPFRRWPLAAVSALVLAGLMACAWQQSRHWRNGESLWAHTLACTSQNPIAHNNLGNALTARGQVDAALAHYRAALEVKPDDVKALNNLGNALAGRGEVDAAIAQYQKALEIQPDDVDAHNNLALALAGRGQVDPAIAHFRRALEIKPDFGLAHDNLGMVLAGRGQVDAAIAQYRTALEIKPDDVQAFNNLGNALAGRGEVDAAVAQYQKALEIKPDDVDARNNLGLALAGRGQVEEAIAQYQKALEIKPDSAEAHYNLGLALAGRGQVEEAIAHYRRAVEIKPDYVKAHNNLGNALAGRGQVEEAIVHFRHALAIKPDDVMARYNLGNALAGCGKVEEAIGHYQKALELKPDFALAHINLADALAGQGRLDEALAHYQRALGLAFARDDKALAEVIRARIKLRQTEAIRKAGN
jgi:tetratricopeptide (TPR) repeat protein